MVPRSHSTIVEGAVPAAADTWMADPIASHREVEAGLSTDDGGGHLMTMLDYYGFLSALALRGYVDCGCC